MYGAAEELQQRAEGVSAEALTCATSFCRIRDYGRLPARLETLFEVYGSSSS
jgi:hypothetical protein